MKTYLSSKFLSYYLLILLLISGHNSLMAQKESPEKTESVKTITINGENYTYRWDFLEGYKEIKNIKGDRNDSFVDLARKIAIDHRIRRFYVRERKYHKFNISYTELASQSGGGTHLILANINGQKYLYSIEAKRQRSGFTHYEVTVHNDPKQRLVEINDANFQKLFKEENLPMFWKIYKKKPKYFASRYEEGYKVETTGTNCVRSYGILIRQDSCELCPAKAPADPGCTFISLDNTVSFLPDGFDEKACNCTKESAFYIKDGLEKKKKKRALNSDGSLDVETLFSKNSCEFEDLAAETAAAIASNPALKKSNQNLDADGRDTMLVSVSMALCNGKTHKIIIHKTNAGNFQIDFYKVVYKLSTDGVNTPEDQPVYSYLTSTGDHISDLYNDENLILSLEDLEKPGMILDENLVKMNVNAIFGAHVDTMNKKTEAAREAAKKYNTLAADNYSKTDLSSIKTHIKDLNDALSKMKKALADTTLTNARLTSYISEMDVDITIITKAIADLNALKAKPVVPVNEPSIRACIAMFIDRLHEEFAAYTDRKHNARIQAIADQFDNEKIENAGKLELKSRYIPIYARGAKHVKEPYAFLKVESVRVQTDYNRISDITIVGCIKDANGEFSGIKEVISNDKYSLSFVALNDDEYSVSFQNPFTLQDDDKALTIYYSDVLLYKPNEKAFTYIVKNGEYSLSPASKYAMLQKRNLNDYLGIKTLIDPFGFLSDVPNGFLQAEGFATIPMNRWNDHIWNFFPQTRANFAYVFASAANTGNRIVTPQLVAPSQNVSTPGTFNYINNLDPMRKYNYKFSLEQSAVAIEIKPWSAWAHFEIGISYYGGRYKYFKKDSVVNNINKIDSTAFDLQRFDLLYPEAGFRFQIRPDERFGLDAAIFYMYSSNFQRGNNNLLNLDNPRYSFQYAPLWGVFRHELNYYAYLSDNSAGGLFFNYTGYFTVYGNNQNSGAGTQSALGYFPQILVGYSTNLKGAIKGIQK